MSHSARQIEVKVLSTHTGDRVVLNFVNERRQQRIEHLQAAFDDEAVDELVEAHAAALTG